MWTRPKVIAPFHSTRGARFPPDESSGRSLRRRVLRFLAIWRRKADGGAPWESAEPQAIARTSALTSRLATTPPIDALRRKPQKSATSTRPSGFAGQRESGFISLPRATASARTRPAGGRLRGKDG